MTAQQPHLFPPDTDCANGRHGELLASPALEIGEAVNVNWTCARCGRCVQTTSYTREAWVKQKATT